MFLDVLSFSGLAWTFKLLPSKHMETSVWHAKPLPTPACGMLGS
jgi:hypothetical protein